jgi:hypothetical protein
LLVKDPIPSSIDRAWNAKLLRVVIPVGWAKVVRALRTIWIRWIRRLAGCGKRGSPSVFGRDPIGMR